MFFFAAEDVSARAARVGSSVRGATDGSVFTWQAPPHGGGVGVGIKAFARSSFLKTSSPRQVDWVGTDSDLADMSCVTGSAAISLSLR